MKYFLLLGFICLSLFAFPQDLNARVELLYPKLQSVNKNTFNALESAIKSFLNNREWSDDLLQNQERIDCNFVITINEWDGSNAFKAEAQIQSSRPVYGTSYNTLVLNINDKDFNFNYLEGQALDFSEQTYTSNLTSLLAFYAFTIAGLDYDTFSKFGGTNLYYRAQNVLNSAQGSPEKGWRAAENYKNRYWLIENLLSTAYNPLREALYTYHRQALDMMVSKPAEGRKAMLSVLPMLQKIDTQRQGNMLGRLFISAKADEIVSILSKAEANEKMQAYYILTQVDPANGLKYEALRK